MTAPAGTIETYNLATMWRDAANLGYNPVVDCQQYDAAAHDDIGKTLRYCLKPPISITEEMLQDPPFVRAAATSLAGVRVISSGGLFRQLRDRQESSAQNPAHGYIDLTAYSAQTQATQYRWAGAEYRPT
jgi:hypothetical protein